MVQRAQEDLRDARWNQDMEKGMTAGGWHLAGLSVCVLTILTRPRQCLQVKHLKQCIKTACTNVTVAVLKRGILSCFSLESCSFPKQQSSLFKETALPSQYLITLCFAVGGWLTRDSSVHTGECLIRTPDLW